MNAVQFAQTAFFLLLGVILLGIAVLGVYIVFVFIRSILQNERSLRNRHSGKGSGDERR